jgi:hypothetical protein
MKPFTALSVVIFAIISLVHFVRVALGWTVTIDSLVIPVWVSILGGAVAAALAVALWREARR